MSLSDITLRETERFTLLKETCEYVCNDLSQSVADDEVLASGCYYLDENILMETVTDYFRNVDIYKRQNDMEGGRINYPKIATLSVLTLLHHKPIKCRHSLDIVHSTFANEWLAYIVAMDSISVAIYDLDDRRTAEILFFIRECHSLDEEPNQERVVETVDHYSYSVRSLRLLMTLMDLIHVHFRANA
ncbi:MAG: hypothetical protein WCF85_07845 [Rhodospirillaceae bacterium]